MSPPPRRIRFAVGSSLLSASLSFGAAACDDAKKPPSNPGPEKNINVGPDPEPEPKPEPTSGAAEPDKRVNVRPDGPEPETIENVPQPEPSPDVEPKRVNVRAPD